MKILMISTPATGHINPLLAIGRMLMAEGHELVCLSGGCLRDRIEGAGVRFRAFAPEADIDMRDISSFAPELATTPPGLEWLRIASERRSRTTISVWWSRPRSPALANEPDVLVVATTGGRPVDAIPGPIPGNARVSSYLPFVWLLPKVDVMVTNGGYGSVNQALSFGVPLVTAGLTEDKADVNARVAWSGVGINLATNEPTPPALREAVRNVLDTPCYPARAAAMAEEFRGIDTRATILRIIEQVVKGADDDVEYYDFPDRGGRAAVFRGNPVRSADDAIALSRA